MNLRINYYTFLNLILLFVCLGNQHTYETIKLIANFSLLTDRVWSTPFSEHADLDFTHVVNKRGQELIS